MSKRNVELIVRKLSKMRGAALKIGQMLSIQDNKSTPDISNILKRVQNSANYMPEKQLNQVLTKELGPNWKDKFLEFCDIPFAAASIGQVHKATLHDGTNVAVKVQYPGVSESITSDLNNVKSFLKLGSLLPKGLYLENTIRVAKLELQMECDYEREADSMIKFAKLINESNFFSANFSIPKVFKELSTKRVLTSEFLPGFSIGEAVKCSQEVRNNVFKFFYHRLEKGC